MENIALLHYLVSDINRNVNGKNIFYLQDTLDIWIMQMAFNFSQVANFHVDICYLSVKYK
jgi:hypothetical protein